MKWLQDNPLGMALAGISGGFVLLAAVLAIVWTLPVAIETAGTAPQEKAGTGVVLTAHQVGSLSEFQVINEKPLFNASRLPVVIEAEDEEAVADVLVAVKDAPEVRLTGIIITPSMKIASLQPIKGKKENIMAHEGESLTGEYLGWHVSLVEPRSVVLESRDGASLKLGLEIHDTRIKEPPRPEPSEKTTQTSDKALSEDGQPLSRAEQIRQRIAERREDLRREQQEQQAQSEAGSGSTAKAAKTNNYRNAIRSMMRNNRKDQASNEKKER